MKKALIAVGVAAAICTFGAQAPVSAERGAAKTGQTFSVSDVAPPTVKREDFTVSYLPPVAVRTPKKPASKAPANRKPALQTADQTASGSTPETEFIAYEGDAGPVLPCWDRRANDICWDGHGVREVGK